MMGHGIVHIRVRDGTFISQTRDGHLDYFVDNRVVDVWATACLLIVNN